MKRTKPYLNALTATDKKNKSFKSFYESFLENLNDEDCDLVTPDSLIKAARAQWEILREYKNNKNSETLIKIHNVASDVCVKKESCSSDISWIEIITPDRPFIVDSIAAAIAHHNYTIEALLHPVIDGLCCVHIRITRIIPDAFRNTLEEALKTTIEDVHYATRDWKAMRVKLLHAKADLESAPKRYDREDIREYMDFLDFLYNDNFTLLGYREYEFYRDKNRELKSRTLSKDCLGVLTDEKRPVYVTESKDGLPNRLQELRRDQGPLSIAKVNKRATVHRDVPMDAIAVKKYNKKGEAIGEKLFIGLFTSITYSRSIQDIPLLRQKARRVIEKANSAEDSHNYKALKHILEKYPRDEIFQMEVKQLYEFSVSILRLQERQRIALYTRIDPFGRYISALVYVPRELYETNLRLAVKDILEEELAGVCLSFQSTLDDSPLARVLFIVQTTQESKDNFNAAHIESRLQEAGRPWQDILSQRLYETIDQPDRAVKLAIAYEDAFPPGYRDIFDEQRALQDIPKIEDVINTGAIALDLYQDSQICDNHIGLRLYHAITPIPLSNILPVLENMGLKIMSEEPFDIQPIHNGQRLDVYLHDFNAQLHDFNESRFKIAKVKEVFEEALIKIWDDQMENDSLNTLILSAQMRWYDVIILRTYIRFMRQARFPFSLPYMEEAITKHPILCKKLVELFKIMHDPALKGSRDKKMKDQNQSIEDSMITVDSLDHDRILRAIQSLMQATLRTNFFMKDRAALSIKIESGRFDDMPNPKPFAEIFVYSPRVEAVHLRGDRIARGGIRWSDRHEDFRTEVLGLMKAQMVKNAVIIPMGAKGGFIVKKPPQTKDRQAQYNEGVACYKIMMQAMLDITDNMRDGKVIPPKNVVRHDDDDPYLVVAADKGTASFSDIANGIADDNDFWLGDAFASGGSQGYDHKKMGITARGAWESVKRHFAEMHHDTQSEPFGVIGVGDMGGDVFGNGMLLSEHIRLYGAFNHLHIFCDPNPNEKSSFEERQRLFKDVKGWDAYDKRKLSKGGEIYDRSEKSLKLTKEIQKRFGITKDSVSPYELMQAMLKSDTDLLWFGGIGTYIKSSDETHIEVSDKANDQIRINADDVKAKVIGEGANLGVTQLARIEYAKRGGKINADFIDNSGGVDSSDHEVNIKILLRDVIKDKKTKLTEKNRNKLLESMTQEVEDHVLRNNEQQALAISLMELSAAENLSSHAQFIEYLEEKHAVSREIEGLPDIDELNIRHNNNCGLTRPELSVIQAYAKILFSKELLETDIPDVVETQNWILGYFPDPLPKKYKNHILKHSLKREIIATLIANGLVNRTGPTFVMSRMEKNACSAGDVVRAYIIVRESFEFRSIWDAIESDNLKIDELVRLKAMRSMQQVLVRGVDWFLTRLGRTPDMAEDIPNFHDGVQSLIDRLVNLVPESQAESIRGRVKVGMKEGFDQKLALKIAEMPVLGAAFDIIRITHEQKTDIEQTARVYFELGEHFHIDWLRQQAHYLPAEDRWQIEALEGLIDHLHSCQAGLTLKILQDMKGKKSTTILKDWLQDHGEAARQLEPVLQDMRHTNTPDLSMLIIAEQRLRAIYGG